MIVDDRAGNTSNRVELLATTSIIFASIYHWIMGSRCSILNDTEHDIWITHGINWPSFTAAVSFLLTFARIGASVVNKDAEKAIVAVNGLTSGLLHFAKAEDEKLKRDRASAEMIKPGEKYTWSGTLSLHMRVYVMNAKLQCDENVCFTGPTADAENIYSISQYFKNLDVK